MKAPSNKRFKEGISRIIDVIENEIAILDVEINKTIENVTAKKKAMMKTVRIGEKKANGLLALLPELGLLDRKQIASLAAVAPHPKQSGQKTWYSRTVGGRKIYQTYIIFSRTHASKSKSSLGNFYNILIHKGKKLMLALVALMRKIIVIAKNVRFTDIVSIFCP